MPPSHPYVDAHTHLDFPVFEPDRDAIIARARAAGVTGYVLAGADPADWDRLVETADALGAACCLGVHPWWAADRSPDQLDSDLERLASTPGLDGIGETGLDWAKAPEEGSRRAAQRASFAAHIELSHARNLPLVLHIVRAHEEALGTLARADIPPAGGMIHGWSGAADHVEAAVELGLHLSFGASIHRSRRARESLARVPDHRLLLETDCPDQPLAGRDRGEPIDLLQIARIAAEVRDTTAETVLALTGENARNLFPLLDP